MKKKEIDKLEAEIMDWFYETVRINFNVEMVQDASELRDILEYFLYDQKLEKAKKKLKSH